MEERVFIAGAGPVGLVAAANLVRQGVPVEEAGKRLKLDDLGWARSASTNTFLFNGSVPGYYAEMKAVLEREQKAGARH